MKKSLSQPEVKNEIISRISKLSPGTEKQWGKMNVNQMMRHSADALRMSYGEIKSQQKPNPWLQQKLMRFVVFNTNIPAPKAKAVTFPEINMVERGINPTDFHSEHGKLLEMVKTYPSSATYADNPMLGKMSKENWARLNYTHLDHHLRQFGV